MAAALIGVHRTDPLRDGSGKADVEPVKATLGPVWGGAVRLDQLAGELVIGEGIETAASAGRLLHLPAWSAVSAGNLAAGLILPASVGPWRSRPTPTRRASVPRGRRRCAGNAKAGPFASLAPTVPAPTSTTYCGEVAMPDGNKGFSVSDADISAPLEFLPHHTGRAAEHDDSTADVGGGADPAVARAGDALCAAWHGEDLCCLEHRLRRRQRHHRSALAGATGAAGIYIDGEMPAGALQERAASIVRGASAQPAIPDFLRFLASDLLPDGLPSIARPEVQTALDPATEDVDVLNS